MPFCSTPSGSFANLEAVFHEAQKLSNRRMKIQLAFLPSRSPFFSSGRSILKHTAARKTPLSDGEVIGWTILLWLLYFRLISVKMVTDLKPLKLIVKLRGVFRSCKIPLADIESVEVITFDPIQRLRRLRHPQHQRRASLRLAYGTRGVRLKLRNGNPVGDRLTADCPEALARAISSRENLLSRH